MSRLEKEPALRRHLTRETAPSLNMLHIKSHGCLLYVEAVLDGVSDGSVLLRDIPEIPGTLNGLYLWLCQRLFTRRGWIKVSFFLDVSPVQAGTNQTNDVSYLFVYLGSAIISSFAGCTSTNHSGRAVQGSSDAGCPDDQIRVPEADANAPETVGFCSS